MESKQFGVDYIVAPMVETEYALSKYIMAKNTVFTNDEQEFTDFLINLETVTSFENLNSIVAKAKNNINGLVFGRVDFSESLGVGREGIHSEEVTQKVIKTGELCKQNGLDLVVGGAVSSDSITVLKQIKEVHLNRFETRKVVLDSEIIKSDDLNDGLVNSVHFELLWLKNKKEYYAVIENEDNERIKMLDERWKILNQ